MSRRTLAPVARSVIDYSLFLAAPSLVARALALGLIHKPARVVTDEEARAIKQSVAHRARRARGLPK